MLIAFRLYKQIEAKENECEQIDSGEKDVEYPDDVIDEIRAEIRRLDK